MGRHGARARARSEKSLRLLLFVSNDNDFITQDGYQAGDAYKDPSGAPTLTR